MSHRYARRVLALLVLVAACSDDSDSTIYVDVNATTGGDGTNGHPFASLHDAVAKADADHVPVVKIAPGRYEIATTITISSPIELRGSQVMNVDADGFPTGAMPGTETEIVSKVPDAMQLLLIGKAEGPVTRDVTIRDLTLEGTNLELISVVKTQGFLIQSNVIRKGGITILTNASSGKISGNHISGAGACGACIAAGNAASPSVVEFSGNRSVGNGAGGVLANGGAPGIQDTDADHLDITIKGNDLSDNVGMQPGFGVRVFVMRRDNGAVGAGQYQGHVKALIEGNRISGNRVGFSIDAGFPYREYGMGDAIMCDTRVYTGTFDLTLKGNRVENSIYKPALITFSRINVPLNPDARRNWQYLHGATFKITDADNSIAGYQLDHPAADPYIGTRCAADAAGETLGNTFTYNGVTTPPTAIQ